MFVDELWKSLAILCNLRNGLVYYGFICGFESFQNNLHDSNE